MDLAFLAVDCAAVLKERAWFHSELAEFRAWKSKAEDKNGLEMMIRFARLAKYAGDYIRLGASSLGKYGPMAHRTDLDGPIKDTMLAFSADVTEYSAYVRLGHAYELMILASKEVTRDEVRKQARSKENRLAITQDWP